MKEALALLLQKQHLDREMAERVAVEMMEGKASDAEMAALLTAMALNGETAVEIASFASVMRARARRVRAPDGAMDVCGTGGASVKNFNVSTAVAMVIAAAGVPVAKHGNRSFTGRSGSADVLEALGAGISIGPEEASRMLEEIGLTFLFAPEYHPATRNVAAVRKQLGFRTVFNMLGPLTNPAHVRRQIVGVPSTHHLELVANALSLLGTERALVVHGAVGMDEMAPVGETAVVEIRGNSLERYSIDARDLVGTVHWKPSHVSSAAESASIIRAVLESRGEEGDRACVVLNAAAALYVGGKAGSMDKGVDIALRVLEEGKAGEKMHQFIEATGRKGHG